MFTHLHVPHTWCQQLCCLNKPKKFYSLINMCMWIQNNMMKSSLPDPSTASADPVRTKCHRGSDTASRLMIRISLNSGLEITNASLPSYTLWQSSFCRSHLIDPGQSSASSGHFSAEYGYVHDPPGRQHVAGFPTTDLKRRNTLMIDMFSSHLITE